MSALIIGVSIREFSRRDNCDEKLVRRAIKSGRLVALPDGKLDPALVGTGWRRTNRRAVRGADNSAAKSAARPDAPVVPDKLPVPDPAADLDEFVAKLLAGQFATFVDAERAKANGLALKAVLAAQREAGTLVEIGSAETVLFEVSRASRDAWLAWPLRTCPLMAAELGIDPEKLTEVVTRYVNSHLDELGETEAHFARRPD